MPTWGSQSKYGEFEIVRGSDGTLRKLGEGAYGKTFEAVRYDEVMGKKNPIYVAVKVLNPRLLSSESKRYQFLREIKALIEIQHPNLILYVRSGEEHGEVYYAMALCRGGDLSTLVRTYKQRIPERAVAAIGLQVASGLRMLEKNRYVHRDIKPSNIMLAEAIGSEIGLQNLSFELEQNESLCKIVDFGLVQLAENAGDTPQGFAGTPMYASPEQIQSRPVDGRSDIYSLGMTLWFLLQGKGPLLDEHGDTLKTTQQVIERHVVEEEHDAHLPSSLSPEFREIMRRMVAKRPEQRFRNAGELQDALRDFLKGRSVAAPSAELARVEASPPPLPPRAPAIAVTQIGKPLLEAYTTKQTLVSPQSHRRYVAVENDSGAWVRLNILADVTQSDPEGVEARKSYLCELCSLSEEPYFPPALFPVRKVVLATDILAGVEEIGADGNYPYIAVSDLLARRQKLPFAEAALFLRPLAEALDFLAERGGEAVTLTFEDVWLTDAGVPGTLPRVDARLKDWKNLRVRFSMIAPPDFVAAEAAEGEERPDATMERAWGDFQNPRLAFALLLFRTLSGAEVDPAVKYLPSQYKTVGGLGPRSNTFLKEVLSGRAAAQGVVEFLQRLCKEEGVVWTRDEASRSRPTGSRLPTDTGSAKTGPGGSSFGGALPRPRTTISQPATESHASQPEPSGSSGGILRPQTHPSEERPARRSGPPPLPSAPASEPGPNTSQAMTQTFPAEVTRTVTEIEVRPLDQDPSQTHTSTTITTDVMIPPGSEIWDVVSPGRVRNPRVSGAMQDVPPMSWLPGRPVRCNTTKKNLYLPLVLDPLFARVEQPGFIKSPYAPAISQRVPWTLWQPGVVVQCGASSKKIALPLDLPLPPGLVDPDRPGWVMSPFDPDSSIEVAPAEWHAEAPIECPKTRMVFELPKDLPPLHAIVDLSEPGLLTSPYDRSKQWRIPPHQWHAGAALACEATGQPLTLPRDVEQWPAEVGVLDPVRRIVSNPFFPESPICIPVAHWARGERVTLSNGRTVILPADLPPLAGDLIEHRVGEIRSPYTGQSVPVEISDWLPGKEILCATGRTFALPPRLPEWIGLGDIFDLPRGQVKSPYRPHPVLTVAPEQWIPGQSLPCPATGRPFRLPEHLPLLEGKVLPGHPGEVESPFSHQTQDVALDDWLGGAEVECRQTHKKFVLPASLEPWLKDGTWVPGIPGAVKSPYQAGAIVHVSSDDWHAGAVIAEPGGVRPFKVPSGSGLLSLEIEKAALEQAWADPDDDEAAAAQKLSRFGASAAAILEIWTRHSLAAKEARLASEETATAIPGELRVVLSPYGSRPRVEIPAAQWGAAEAHLHCPETGRRFKLPPGLPPLNAVARVEEPGLVHSPYDSAKSWLLPPPEWRSGARVTCESTGRPMLLPAEVEQWTAEAALADLSLRQVTNPYHPGGTIAVAGSEWVAGGRITAPGGRALLLPADLPPLTGELIENRFGEIRSPYNDAPVPVSLDDWTPGTRVECPGTGRRFLLPAALPEWIGEADLSGLTPGQVKSPYRPHAVLTAPPGQWQPGELLTCPSTARRFRLPEQLPLLLGGVTPGTPGRVQSPFSSEWQEIALDDWTAGAEVECAQTHRKFALPTPLEEWLKDGSWVPGNPGAVRSPFQSGVIVQVAAEQWRAGEVISEPGGARRFKVPSGAALPPLELEKAALEQAWAHPDVGEKAAAQALARFEASSASILAIWSRHGLGTKAARLACEETGESVPGELLVVLSPYGSHPRTPIPAAEWGAADARAHCPETGRRFKLPAGLPPLPAMARVEEPGVIHSPYDPAKSWTLPPPEWQSGAIIPCASTGRAMVLPAEVDQWAAEAALADLPAHRITNPYVPGETIEVPGSAWLPGGRVSAPSGRAIVLPPTLPPLTGELVGSRSGQIRSPYSGEPVSVGMDEWAAGAEVQCPATGRRFLLPSPLPEWIGEADLSGLPPGQARSPYRPNPVVPVAPDCWQPRELLECPSTGRRFRLPEQVPLLEGSVTPGSPGRVRSPFSSEWQEISLDDWAAGAEIECRQTHRKFVLPTPLEEWLMDGSWIPGIPGAVKSPFRSGAVVQVAEAQWRAGEVISEADGVRRFKVPSGAALPALELEKAAVAHVWAHPDDEEAAAAQALTRFGAPAAAILEIWRRHGLGTKEARQAGEQTGDAIPGELLVVQSPYGSRPRTAIPAADWGASGAHALCPETGRRFKLPEGLPPLEAVASVQEPGLIHSPYDPAASWTIPPADWRSGARVACASTGRGLVLPAAVDQWVAEAAVADAAQRLVTNPYRLGETIAVPGAAWVSGGQIAAPSGRAVLLPADLPPLTGEIIEGQTGQIQSPYSGEPVAVDLDLWVGGAEVACHSTGRAFLLPASLPEWIGDADLSGLPPGQARSPYLPNPVVEATPDQWQPRQLLTCPSTGRRFRLPEQLPLLHGAVTPGNPGRVKSPFSAEWQEITLDDWVEGAAIECRRTQRIFALPTPLEVWLKEGSWEPGAPGAVRSPFKSRELVHVTEAEWRPGGIVSEPGGLRPFLIPASETLPPLALENAAVQAAWTQPEASEETVAGELSAAFPGTTAALILSIWTRHRLETVEKRVACEQIGEGIAGQPLRVLSPYGSKPEVALSVADRVATPPTARCPETGRRFRLPDTLGPIDAIAHPDSPGTLSTPYHPATTWTIPPTDWKSGLEIECPYSHQPLLLPAAVDTWPATAELLDLGMRLVSNPFCPGESIQVPGSAWIPGGPISSPSTERAIVLPGDLPPLAGEAIEHCTGEIISPYTGERIPVSVDDWESGKEITVGGRKLVLPHDLPAWVAEGIIEGLPPGQVRSPYKPNEVVAVAPAEWVGSQVLTCPRTNRPFHLPASLPLLEGKVKIGKLHYAISPFSGEEQVITIDEWTPGRMVECLATHRNFVLPADLEEWLEKGSWVKGIPGRIRGPFRGSAEFDIPEDQWKAGGVVRCPAIGRRFRIPPEDLFPPLALEKDAVEFALAHPDTTEDAGLRALQGRHPSLTLAQLQSIWKRHDLDTDEKRLGMQQTGEALAEYPGYVKSPYSSARVKLTAAQWLGENASAQCPETKRFFRLPKELPPLEAGVEPNQPGNVVSPFAPEEPFSVRVAEWIPGIEIRCRRSGHPLRMPAVLPEWDPTGVLIPGKLGWVVSPFGRHLSMPVPPANWAAGIVVKCLETGDEFKMPKDLPPMVGSVTPGVPGMAQSPYATGPAVAVSKKSWRPGERVICAETGRPFLLPNELPVWKGKSPVGLIAALAAILVLAAAGAWYVISQKTRESRGAWPQEIQLGALSPEDATVLLKQEGGSESVTVKPVRGAGDQGWSISLAAPEVKKWLARRQSDTALVLHFSTPKYLPASRRFERSKDPVAKVDGVQLAQEPTATPPPAPVATATPPPTPKPVPEIEVAWTSGSQKFYERYYQSVRFEPADGTREIVVSIAEGKHRLPVGKYQVTLVGRRVASEFNGKPLRVNVADRALKQGDSDTYDLRANQSLVLPPMPQSLAGLGIVRQSIKAQTLTAKGEERGQTNDLGVRDETISLRYLSPCLVRFNEDFSGGSFIDENQTLASLSVQLLDHLIYTLATLQMKQYRFETEPYKTNLPKLKKAVAAAQITKEELARVKNVSELTSMLAAKRKEFLKWSTEIYESQKDHNTPSASDKTGEIWTSEVANQYIQDLAKKTLGDAWNKSMSAILGPKATEIPAADLASLTDPVHIGEHTALGALVSQDFRVSNIDENGDVTILVIERYLQYWGRSDINPGLSGVLSKTLGDPAAEDPDMDVAAVLQRLMSKDGAPFSLNLEKDAENHWNRRIYLRPN